jgi:hypothetical protein
MLKNYCNEMANYLLCHKEFKSLGKSYIELADININKISVQIDCEKHDRTQFLKYGCCYKKKQEQINVTVIKINGNINICKNDIGYYFKYTGSLISKNDKLSFDVSNSDKKIFCIVEQIEGSKHYIQYFDNFENDIRQISFSYISIYNYENMEECTCLYELFINDNSLTNNTIPFFMPKMTQNMSSEKKILIHVSKNVDNCSILFSSYDNYYINNLDCNEDFRVNHSKEYIDDSKNYTTYSVVLLYNGNKSWFII